MTFIELMSSLTISILLINIVTMSWMSAQQNFQKQLVWNVMQEDALTTLKILRSDLQLAGYIGSGKLTSDFPIKNFPPYVLNKQNSIEISSHRLTVRHTDINHVNLNEDMRSDSVIYVNADIHFDRNDILLISDFRSAEIFQVKSVEMMQGIQKITTSLPLKKQYLRYAEVSKLEVNTYFVDKTGRFSKQGQPIYALYMSDLLQHKKEIVENLQEMTVLPEGNGIELTLDFTSDSGVQGKWFAYVCL